MRKHTGQAAPPGWGIAQTELLRDLASQAPPLQVLNGARVSLEAISVVLGRALQDIGEGVLPGSCLRCSGLLLGV